MSGFYTDLDFSMFRNPVTDDVAKKLDDNAIKQSLKNLILLRKFESPFHPEICSQVTDSLFETFTPLTKSVLERAITYTIENFEHRVDLISVDVTDDSIHNAIVVTIRYQIIANGVQSSYSFAINRTR